MIIEDLLTDHLWQNLVRFTGCCSFLQQFSSRGPSFFKEIYIPHIDTLCYRVLIYATRYPKNLTSSSTIYILVETARDKSMTESCPCLIFHWRENVVLANIYLDHLSNHGLLFQYSLRKVLFKLSGDLHWLAVGQRSDPWLGHSKTSLWAVGKCDSSSWSSFWQWPAGFVPKYLPSWREASLKRHAATTMLHSTHGDWWAVSYLDKIDLLELRPIKVSDNKPSFRDLIIVLHDTSNGLGSF